MREDSLAGKRVDRMFCKEKTCHHVIKVNIYVWQNLVLLNQILKDVLYSATFEMTFLIPSLIVTAFNPFWK